MNPHTEERIEFARSIPSNFLYAWNMVQVHREANEEGKRLVLAAIEEDGKGGLFLFDDTGALRRKP